MQEKYLIMKLDEESLIHFPERISDLPLPLMVDIKQEELHQYQQIVLKGDGVDINTLRAILFPAETDHKIFFQNRTIQAERENKWPYERNSSSLNSLIMSLEEKYEITNQVLKELSITARSLYTKDTVLTVGVIKDLIEQTLKRVENDNNNIEIENLNPDDTLPEH